MKTISFVGAGALATGLASLLRARGFEIDEIITRATAQSKRKAAKLARAVGARVASVDEAALTCDLLWIAVPDEAIEGVAAELAVRERLPKIAVHASGALSSAALRGLAERGVKTGSAHPMMTFVAGEPPSLEGAWFAVEGHAAAVTASRALATALGAKTFTIAPEQKVVYHAFGAMLSPMLATELEAAERVGLRAGISARDVRRIMEPIVLRTVRNVLANGAGKSFSGPLARGDVRTVGAHLESLAGSAEGDVYRALVEYATQTLPVKRAEEMKMLLRGKKRAK